MKKYLFYASMLLLAAYTGNRYNAEAPLKTQPVLVTGSAAEPAANAPVKPVPTHLLPELPGIKPAYVFLLE